MFKATAGIYRKSNPLRRQVSLHGGGDIHFVSPQLAGGEMRIGGDITYQGRNTSRTKNNDYSFITITPACPA